MRRPRLRFRASWLLLAAALLSLYLLSGCAHAPPKSDELGDAVECIWLWNQPVVCTEDPNRLTMDIDTYYKLMDQLEQTHIEEFRRRSL
jgi:hypothetical protein